MAGAIVAVVPAGASASPLSLSQAPAGLQAAVRSAVGTSSAPPTSIFQQAKLTASDVSPGDEFGGKVWINGTIAVVGAPDQNTDQGAAYVFVRSGSNWSQQAKLTDPGATAGDYFGGWVAIAGTTVVVGASGDAGGTGAAYVFVQSKTSWPEQAKLTASDGVAGDHFAAALGIDGENVLVGAPDRNSGVGAAYVFHRTGTTWAQQAELTAPDGVAGDYYGSAVAIHGPEVGGPTTAIAVVGSPYKNSDTGAAYTYSQNVNAQAWPYQTELTASDGTAGDYFGSALGVWGLNVVIGAPHKSSSAGAAYVFHRSGASTWSQQAELTASDAAAGDMFGSAVDMSHSTAVVGAPDRNSDTGAAYVFTRSGSAAWPQVTELNASDGTSGDHFGDSVSISKSSVVVGAYGESSSSGAAYAFAIPALESEMTATGGATNDHFGTSIAFNGSTAVVGAPGNSSSQGAVYVFTGSGFHWTQQAELTASDGAAGDDFGKSLALYGSTLVVGAPGKSSGAGAAYVFVESAGTWQQQAELTPSDPTAGDAFGSSVAISKSTAAVGAPQKNGGAGAAYVFAQSGSTWSQQAELTSSDSAAGDEFGNSVAVYGATVAVGAPDHNSSTGAAYVFQLGTSWRQRTELTASDATANDEFGWAVAMYGSNLVIGAPNHSGTGASYVFGGSGSNWTQHGELTAGGHSVAIYSSTIVVGRPGANGTGAAYLYTPVNGAWVQQAQLTAPDAASGDQFGASVAVEGSTGLAGAPDHNSGTGAAYMFMDL